jgi:hypothetical protein
VEWVEFDAARSDALNGCTWLDLDAEVVARLEPETGRPGCGFVGLLSVPMVGRRCCLCGSYPG